MADKKKKKFPDLTGDGKVTQKDILKGRGVLKRGGTAKKKTTKKKRSKAMGGGMMKKRARGGKI